MAYILRLIGLGHTRFKCNSRRFFFIDHFDQRSCIPRLFEAIRHDQPNCLTEIVNLRILQQRDNIATDTPLLAAKRTVKLERIERSENPNYAATFFRSAQIKRSDLPAPNAPLDKIAEAHVSAVVITRILSPPLTLSFCIK